MIHSSILRPQEITMKIQVNTPDLVIFESELWRTTVSLIIGREYILLVDPNWLEQDLIFIEEYIEKIKGNKECYLLFTHSDYDHIIGYSRFKNYSCIASENFVNNPNKKAALKPALDFDDKYYIHRQVPLAYPEIDLVIKQDYQELTIGEDQYIFIQAAGHNEDGIISYNKSKGIIILGDYLSNIEFPYIYESVIAYKIVLDKLEALLNEELIHYLIPGHGDFTSDKAEMEQRIFDSRKYINALETYGDLDDLKPFQEFIHGFGYPHIMTEFHMGNLKLWREEKKGFQRT